MITYRIAFVGDETQAYSKAQEYFSMEREAEEDSVFKIELIDISKLSELEIKSMNFHSVVYDIEEVAGTDKDRSLRALLESKKQISDLKIFPLTRESVTRTDVEIEENRLIELYGKETNIQAIPINVSNQSDLKSVFQAIEVASVEYRSLAENVLETQEMEFEMTAQTLLDAMEEKSPYTASHFRQVGVLSEAIAKFMGKDEQEVRKTKSIAILHDAGKLLMPAELLNNPHMTVGNERDQMALHSELGEVVIAQDLFDLEERGGIVEHHNSGTDNKYAKIIAVADCIDTMTSQRAYNNPKSIQDVFRDLARNMYGRKFIDKNGNEINLPAQFDKDVAISTIIMLAQELGSIGYDVRKMIEATGNNRTNAQDDELMQIFAEHENEIFINQDAKIGEYTSLGFRLTDTGHLDFEDRPAAIINRETRVRSEYEFLIFKNSSGAKKNVAKTIMDLEANFSEEELVGFRKIAEEKINSEDEIGRLAVQTGSVVKGQEKSIDDNVLEKKRKKDIAVQIIEAAKLDKNFCKNGMKKFLSEISRTIEPRVNVESKDELRRV